MDYKNLKDKEKEIAKHFTRLERKRIIYLIERVIGSYSSTTKWYGFYVQAFNDLIDKIKPGSGLK